ncbi:MAG: PDZ domain-containing protein [Opitutales bacterium]|nr:PDZ domain-containing protein [Opitutales bacterium]
MNKVNYWMMAMSVLLPAATLFADSEQINVPAGEEVSFAPAKAGPSGRARPFVGVALQDRHCLHLDYGVPVIFVQKDSPAAKAGFVAGDILREFDGQKIFNSNQFFNLLRTYKPGETLPAVLLRNGETISANVTLEIRPGKLLSKNAPAKDRKQLVPQESPRDDVVVIINGKEYSLSNNMRDWLDRISVTKDALIIRTDKVRDELSAFADRLRAHIDRAEKKDAATIQIQMANLENAASHTAFSRRYYGDGIDIVYSGSDEKRHLTVKKQEGEAGGSTVLFDGPCATQEEIDAIPQEVKEIVEKFMSLKLKVVEPSNQDKSGQDDKK